MTDEIPLASGSKMTHRTALPPTLAPRGLSRAEAAAYIGVSPTLFDAMIGDGRMPGPKRVNARTIWDRVKLDAAFDDLPGDGGDAAVWGKPSV